MKTIKYRYSGGHKTILDIDDKDVIMRIAINCAIKVYKADFKSLCKQYYKEGNKSFVIEAAIKDQKNVIRDYLAIRESLDRPLEVTNKETAETIIAKLF